MRLHRRPTAFVIFLRCLVMTVSGPSTGVAAPTDTAIVTASPPRDLGGGKVLRFVSQPPSPTDRRRGRLRHRDLVTFRKLRPVTDVITEDYVDLMSTGNHIVSDDIRSGFGKDVNNRASKYRTETDSTAAETETEVDTAAATARRRLPDVIVIGAKKSGTRAILEFLKLHPDVRAAGRETHFFDRFYDRGLDWYRSRMPATTSGQLTVEKTPSYLVNGRVVDRVFEMDPDVRLLVVVRDPVTRAVSDYTQASTKRPDIAPFEQLAFVTRNVTNSQLDCWTANESGACQVNTSWGAIRISLYVRHVERWLRRFPLSQMHFVHGEQLVRDPAGQMRLVEQFLGLRPVVNESHFQLDAVKGFPCIVRASQPHCLGKTKGRTHRKVDERALGRLREFFRPFNEQFYRVVGIDFGWA